jgi:hypothetical protein
MRCLLDRVALDGIDSVYRRNSLVLVCSLIIALVLDLLLPFRYKFHIYFQCCFVVDPLSPPFASIVYHVPLMLPLPCKYLALASIRGSWNWGLFSPCCTFACLCPSHTLSHVTDHLGVGNPTYSSIVLGSLGHCIVLFYPWNLPFFKLTDRLNVCHIMFIPVKLLETLNTMWWIGIVRGWANPWPVRVGYRWVRVWVGILLPVTNPYPSCRCRRYRCHIRANGPTVNNDTWLLHLGGVFNAKSYLRDLGLGLR